MCGAAVAVYQTAQHLIPEGSNQLREPAILQDCHGFILFV
jgi:hypothetical protein